MVNDPSLRLNCVSRKWLRSEIVDVMFLNPFIHALSRFTCLPGEVQITFDGWQDRLIIFKISVAAVYRLDPLEGKEERMD